MRPADPLERLIADWLGGTISPEDFRVLDARLRTDPAARVALRRAATYHFGTLSAPQPMAPGTRMLAARQRAVVAITPSAASPEVATLTPGEIAPVLAWQHRLLNFTATPLGDIVAADNRRNATQLVLADPALAALRVSASLRSDNVHGFVTLLETGFGVRAERRGDSEILLSRPP